MLNILVNLSTTTVKRYHGPSRDETLLEIRIISQCDHLLHQEKILGHQFLTGMSIPVKN